MDEEASAEAMCLVDTLNRLEKGWPADSLMLDPCVGILRFIIMILQRGGQGAAGTA